VRLLLDTHVFLWAITDDARLSVAHRVQYIDQESELYLSVASIWEMLIKLGLRKLSLPLPATDYLHRQMEKNRVHAMTIRVSHMVELEKLPPLHRDPFDRLLVAQARAERMPILTADPAIRNYDVDVL